MMSIKRLRIENINLQKEPVPLALARPKEDNVLEWRFLIKGAEGTDYEGGYYHGKLIFPPQYPMKPPGIMFCTPSGRFEINKRVCLTISDFHPETWSPLWTVGSILTGIVSFMNSDELTTGGLAASSAERKSLAIASTAYNAKDKIYVEVFGSGPPLELFRESEAILNEINKKRLEKSQAPSSVTKKISTPPPAVAAITTASPVHTIPTSTTVIGTVRSSADVEGEKGGTVALSKSAKKRAKEKEKARRQKEAADNGISYVVGSNDGSDDEGDDISEANDLVADMKISGDDRS